MSSLPKTIATAFAAPVAPIADPQLCEPEFISFNYGVSTFSCMLRGYEVSLLKGIEIIIIAGAAGFGVMKFVVSGKRMF